MKFLKQAIKELLVDDGLIVMARECGYRQLFARFVKYYALKTKDQKQVVFILNADKSMELIINELQSMSLDPSQYPQLISTDTGTVKERRSVYSNGGVYFISSRILQLDFLQNHLPLQSITGILVYNAHTLKPGSTHLFCLLLFRARCKGFVKCFSDNAMGIVYSFPQLSSLLKELSVGYLFLYPRSTEIVVSCFNEYPLSVSETTFVYSSWMDTIQQCIEAGINSNILELKKLRCELNDRLSVDYCLQYLFPLFAYGDIKNHAEWYSTKTKDLLKELVNLSELSKALNTYSIITFYKKLDDILRPLRNRVQSVEYYWIGSKECDMMETVLHDEIFGILNNPQLEREWLEPPEKWSGLLSILDEANEANDTDSPQVVLISVYDASSIHEIHNFLTIPSLYMLYSLQNALSRHIFTESNSSSCSSRETQLLPIVREQLISRSKQNDNNYNTQLAMQHQISLQQVYDILQNHNSVVEVIYHKFSKLKLFLSPSSLSDTRYNPFMLCNPSLLILLDANYVPLRQAEIYNYQTKGHKLSTVHFCCYEGCEQQNYEHSLHRELDGFLKLISERNQIVKSSSWSQPTSTILSSSRDFSKKSTQLPTIIVDSREFNASLPSALFKSGVQLLPVTLTICDYVLSPTVGVERKSFNDLVGSFSSGRLQKQMKQMSQCYRSPLLLIEMKDGERDFYKENGEVTITMVKLFILLREYRNMRILWSFSDRSTCKMFELVKKGKEEPNLETAMESGENTYLNGDKSEVDRIDLLLNFPGITLDNVYSILSRIKKVNDICQWTQVYMEEMMTSHDASLLYKFLHKPITKLP